MSGCWCVRGGGGARGEAPKWWSSISRSVVNTWLLAQGCKACSNGFGIGGLKSALRESASRGAWDLSLEARERRTQSTRWVDKHGHCASVRRLSFIKQSASRHVLQVELTWYLLAILGKDCFHDRMFFHTKYLTPVKIPPYRNTIEFGQFNSDSTAGLITRRV